MRTRDVYASLRELVPTLVERPSEIVVGWSDRADPVWRRGEDWVRAEFITSSQLSISAGRGDATAVQRMYALSTDLEPVARDIAGLLGGAGVA
jgi:hypothetical protein